MAILRWPDPRLAEVCALYELDQFVGLVTLAQVDPAKRATRETEHSGVVA